MAKNSAIEWTHHTFNPWWGCVRVSLGCKNCYAEAWAKRVGLEVWGRGASRRFFSDAHWKEPLRWNEEAKRYRTRRRVFCASMADVFEKRLELDLWRDRLWTVIQETPWLDWLLLTKRPERVGESVPWGDLWPRNVWLGTTAENQRCAEKRVPLLLSYPAVVRFVSAEPLVGPLDLTRWLVCDRNERRVDWVIAGGESGARARPMNPDWARHLRDQCGASGVPFHFKQWGHWRPETDNLEIKAQRIILHGNAGIPITLVRLGKKAAGRDLDGKTWDELPGPVAAS
jgi:protein gp37